MTTRVFQSVHHPGDASLALVVARAQAQPVAFAFVGVMTVTLAAVLRGEPVLGSLLWAVPLAYLSAALWAAYDLRRKPAEIVLRGGFGVIRSVWDVARSGETSAERVRFEPVFEPGRKDGQRHAAIGDTVMVLRPSEWPQREELLEALMEAALTLQGHAAR